MNREFYESIILKMLEDNPIDQYIIDNIVDKCMIIDDLVCLGNDNPNHNLVSTQVIALIVYDYLNQY